MHLQDGDQSPEKIERALTRIYPAILAQALEFRRPEWWREFCTSAQVWSENKRFVPKDEIYIGDDGNLKEMFIEKGINFAWCPQNLSINDYLPLLHDELDVALLSEATESTPVLPNSEPPESTTPLFTKWAKKLICHFLWNDKRKDYLKIKEKGMLELFLGLQERLLPQVQVYFNLGGAFQSEEPDNIPAFWDYEKCQLYKSESSKDDWEIVMPTIIARQLIGENSRSILEYFIGGVLGASEVKAHSMIKRYNWVLPLQEEEWINKVLELPYEPLLPEEEIGPKPEHEVNLLVPRDVPSDKAPIIPAPIPPRPDEQPRPIGRHSPRTRRGVYVESTQPRSDSSSKARISHRTEVSQAGVNFAKAYEQKQNRLVVDMNELYPNHKGWDLQSKDKEGKLVRRIEVKATEKEWSGWAVDVTSEQFVSAQKYTDDFYLYVVEYALLPEKRRLYIFHNPYEKVTDYFFDGSWKFVNDGMWSDEFEDENPKH